MSTPIYKFEVKGGDTVVDSDKGVIHGVSMITGGLEAKGHGLQVDKTTLKQIHQCAAKMGKVPVKTNHGTGVDAVNGYLHNFRIDGDKVRGDWVLLKKYPTTDHLMEMAEKMPESVGLSVAFRGDPELADGTPVYFDQELKQHYTLKAGQRQTVAAGTKLFARCAELVSTDLVASPAANPNGMFAAGVDSDGDGMAKTSLPAIPVSTASSEEQVPAWAKALTEKLDDISGRLDAIEQGAENEDDDADALTEEEIQAGLEDGTLIDNGDGTVSYAAQNAEGAEGDEGDEGDDGEGAAEGVPAEAAAALARGDVHTYFAVLAEQAAARMVEHRFAAMAQAEAKAAEVQAFNALQAKTAKVTELAEQQKQQIIALQAENQELRRVKGIKTPSAGTENFFGAKPGDAAQLTTFEQATTHYYNEFKAKGESDVDAKAHATQFATKNHPDLMEEYLIRKGIRPRA